MSNFGGFILIKHLVYVSDMALWFDVAPIMDNKKEHDFKVWGAKKLAMGLEVHVIKNTNCAEQ